MTQNTSATGGYLAPTTTLDAPLEDEGLDDLLHDVVVGITGIDPMLVRPRWQPEPPNLPSRTTNWIAFGVTGRKADTNAVELHDPNGAAGNGSSTVIRHEELSLLCSFYGPNCQGLGATLRDGLGVAQNREGLRAAGLALVSVGDLTKAPEMIKNQWLGRADLTIVIRRQVQREYRVLNLLSANGTIITDPETIDIVASHG